MTLGQSLERGAKVMIDGGARGVVVGSIRCGRNLDSYTIRLEGGRIAQVPTWQVWPLEPPAGKPPVKRVVARLA